MRCQNLQQSNNFVLFQRQRQNDQQHHLLTFFVITCCILIHSALAMPTADFETHHIDEQPKFVVIQEDVIPDVENTTQKVIRVNPLDLPPIRDDPTGSSDSDLYKIKALLPAHRSYASSKRMRRPRPLMNDNGHPATIMATAANDSPILRHQPDGKLQKPKHQQPHKKKQLHFLYNQDALDGRSVGKSMRVHVAPGAYPVYYAVSKTNGRFGKYPIKGFSNDRDFMKYLIKHKLEPIELAKRSES